MSIRFCPRASLTLTGLSEKQSNRIAIRRYLRNAGLDEFLTYTLVNADLDGRFAYLEKGPSYRLKNPMTNDHEFVRRGLLPSLLNAVAYNADRQEKNVACFEVSDIDAPSNKTSHLGLVLAGEESLAREVLKKKAYDFYDAKGLLEGIMAITESWDQPLSDRTAGASGAMNSTRANPPKSGWARNS
jgi:phenylalanyl-tRNA synthetase beta chain